MVGNQLNVLMFNDALIKNYNLWVTGVSVVWLCYLMRMKRFGVYIPSSDSKLQRGLPHVKIILKPKIQTFKILKIIRYV